MALKKRYKKNTSVGCFWFLYLFSCCVTGILQLKRVEWIQPKTEEVAIDTLSINFSDILSSSQGILEAQIEDWSDIDRLDVRQIKEL